MFPAGHQAQAEACTVQHNMCGHEKQRGNHHEPAQLKAPDVQEGERPLLIDILDGGGDIVRVLRHIQRLDKDSRGGGAQKIHRRAHQRLIRLEVDGRHGQQQGIRHAKDHAAQHDAQEHEKARQVRIKPHDQRAAQRADDHDAFQAEIDHPAVFGEAPAQRHQKQHGCIDQRILQQERHISFLLSRFGSGTVSYCT